MSSPSSSSRLIAISNPAGAWFAIEVATIGQDDRKAEAPKQEPRRELTVVEPTDPIVEISDALGRIVRLARGLPPDRARKARELVSAPSSLLHATTALDPSHQALFEEGLRNAKD